MFRIIRERVKQQHRTMSWPDGPAPEMPDRYAGAPILKSGCAEGCAICVDVCPVQALTVSGDRKRDVRLDLGRCIFCRQCEAACPENHIEFSADYRMASGTRGGLTVSAGRELPRDVLLEKARKLFGHSLKLRQVSAGGCNACEADINVLSTIGWDLGRFGIQIVASPRHADGLIITGPVTQQMKAALEKTYVAVPDPKIVIAVGACACTGGLFADHEEQGGGADSVVPVDLYIPGCPPHPMTILDGLLRFIGKINEGGTR